MKKTITFEEAILTVPTTTNRNTTHQFVMDAYNMGGEAGERKFIYDCRILNEEITAVTIRQNTLPTHFNAAKKEINLIEGERLRFTVTINTVKQSEGKEIAVDDVIEFAEGRLSSRGWTDINILSANLGVHSVKKGKHKYKLALCRYIVEAAVSDPEKIAETMLHGIGRAKGYGSGLLQLGAK